MNILPITYGTIEIIILSAAVISISIIAAVRKILAYIATVKHTNKAVLMLPSGKEQKEMTKFSTHRDFYCSSVVIRRKAENKRPCFNTTGKNHSGTFLIPVLPAIKSDFLDKR